MKEVKNKCSIEENLKGKNSYKIYKIFLKIIGEKDDSYNNIKNLKDVKLFL